MKGTPACTDREGEDVRREEERDPTMRFMRSTREANQL